MRVHSVLLAAAAIALPTTEGVAQVSAPAKDEPGIVVKGQKEKKVCKTFEAPTGSRVGERRLCKSPAEWKIAEDAALRSVDRMNMHIQADQAQTLNERGRGPLSNPLPR